MTWIKRVRPSPAIVIAVIALGAALAGTALAGSGPTADTSKSAKGLAKQALDKANKARKKSNKAKKKAKAAQEAANSAQGDADAALSGLGGVTVRSIRYVRTAADASETTILNLKGLQLVATCTADGGPVVSARTTASNSYIQNNAFDNDSDNSTHNQVANTDFDPTDPDVNLLLDETSNINAHTEYATPGGAQVTVNWTALSSSGGFPNPHCGITGHAVGSG